MKRYNIAQHAKRGNALYRYRYWIGTDLGIRDPIQNRNRKNGI
jgi:hypothetical protein